MSEPAQQSLFGDIDEFAAWAEEWRGMPEFRQDELGPWKSFAVHFTCRADLERFASLVGQKLTPDTRSIWFPAAEIGRYADKRYAVPGQAPAGPVEYDQGVEAGPEEQPEELA